MIFGEVPIAEAAGTILAHSVLVAGRRWAKGRSLTAHDVAVAHSVGIATLTVARFEADDVGEDAAAAALAARLAGTGIEALAPAHGRVNLVAQAAGLIRVEKGSVDAINAQDERLTLGTLRHLTRVAAGEIVATVKVIPFAVPQAVLAAAAATAVPLTIASFRQFHFVLVQSVLPGTPAKLLARTEAVTRARIERLGSSLDPPITCDHAIEAVAQVMRTAPDDAVLLIAGASATADRRDIIPAAIIAAGGRVERLGMPVDPGNLLCLGELGGRPVIGLPGCARSPKRNGFDWVLERIIAGVAVTSADIAAMGSGGLLPDTDRPQPRRPQGVGVVVLAAGRSSRMGVEHKLLADLNGAPVIARTLDAIAAAELPVPVVVVGHRAEAVQAALSGRSAHVVVATDYAEGLSRSLATGLAAAPASWQSLLVVLGDMPLVSPATLAALAAAAADADAVIVPVHHGRRGNPIAWGRAHWPRLMALTGDRGARALLDAVDVEELPVDDPGILADIDTPAALAAVRAMSPASR